MEKCIWAEISNLDEDRGCFASNEYLAKIMDSSPASIANSVSKLRKMGLIVDVGFDGRRRFIKAIVPSALTCGLTLPSPVGEPCLNPAVNIDTRVDSSLEKTPIVPVANQPAVVQAPKPIAPDGAPLAPEKKALIKGKLQLRAEALFRRTADKPLDASEARALKGAKQAILSTTEEDWLFLERFYAAPQAETYARKGFAQLLNNWNGEITKAREWCKSRGISFGQPSAAVRPEDVEPDGWREYLAETYPDHNLHTGAWRSISRANRIDFIREIAASKSK